MVADIGAFLFVDLLGMTMYPGYPFTGVIVRDIIMFFFIPTVFLIMIIYVLTGRIFSTNKQLRLMLGLAVYLFIIAGGYFKTFALLAGPYFIFLIFILGLVYFIPTHFRVAGHGFSKSGFGNSSAITGSDSKFEIIYEKELAIEELKKSIKELRTQHSPDAQRGVADLYRQQATLQAEIRALLDSLNGAEKSYYKTWFKSRKNMPF